MRSTIQTISTKDRMQHVLLLTLMIVMFATFSHADTYAPVDKQRISDVENYLRKQTLKQTALLPEQIRSAIGWFSNEKHLLPSLPFADDENENGGDDEKFLTASTPPSSGPFQFTSNFHHKGFLPTHDALMMGFALSKGMLDDKLFFTAHPYYGQNWRSLRGYWGGNLVMDIAQRSDDLPWGQLSLGYVGGNESLTDHGRGIDFHGDVDLTNGFKFTSGVRNNSGEGSSNYILLRWKLALM